MKFSFILPFLWVSALAYQMDHDETAVSSTSLRGGAPLALEPLTNEKKPGRERKLNVNPSDAAQEMAIALGWSVPIAGPLISVALTFYFDGSNPSVWDQVKAAVESMVTLSDVMDDTNAFESHMTTLTTLMNYYDGASSNSVKGGYLKNLVAEALRIHNIFQLDIATFNLDCVSSPSTCDKNQLENNYYLMEYAVVFAPLHLAILKDQYLYGHYLYCSGTDCPHTSDIEAYKTQLTSFAATYQTYFDFMRSNMWLQWRQDTFYYTLSCSFSHINFPAPGSTSKTTWKLYDRLGYFGRKRERDTCGRNSCSSSKDCARDQADSYRDGPNRKDILETNFNTLLSPMASIGTTPISGLPSTSELCTIGEKWCDSSSACISVDSSCSGGGGGKRRRRMDALVSQDILENSDWEDLKTTCFEEKYQLRLVVDDHMFLLATPTSENSSSLCKDTLVFHRGWDQNQIITHKNKEEEDEEFWSLGTFHLEDIAGAHDSVANLGSMDGDDYHVVFNNCGNYILEFFAFLDIEPTPEMMKFAASRVANHYDGSLIDELVIAMQVSSVDRTKMTDEQIIIQAFEYGIAEMKLNRSRLDQEDQGTRERRTGEGDGRVAF